MALNGNQHGLAHNPNAYKKKFSFAETEQEILDKYEGISLEFHIHENHYRFGNQDGVISKGNAMIREFLEYIARREIPHPIVEVLRDAGMVFYEGCLILQVLDHRNAKELEVKNEQGIEKKVVPRSYRTLLRPTPLSLFYDLLSQTDSAMQRFSDNLGLSMESEILTLTNRNVDLKVPLNPYKLTCYTPDTHFPIVNHSTGEILHNHRLESNDPNSKAFQPYRELHEDSPHQASDYEQFMLTLTDQPTEGQFTRLRFVEQYRLNKEKLKHASMNAVSRPFGNGSPLGNGLTPQQVQQRRLQQLQMQQKSIAQQQLQGGSGMATLGVPGGGSSSSGSSAKKKSPMKKGVAGKTLPGYGDKTLPGTSQEPSKKKRGTYKKKAKN
jgi:transcription factor SPT20